jgi:hypothetical protein
MDVWTGLSGELFIYQLVDSLRVCGLTKSPRVLWQQLLTGETLKIYSNPGLKQAMKLPACYPWHQLSSILAAQRLSLKGLERWLNWLAGTSSPVARG